MNKDIYSDIAERTDGDIYIGIVGPVRTGKSTFIKRFMESLVIPNIDSEFKRERAVDELPQSAAGKTIMTTEPKFIPEEAVEVSLDNGARFNVRMIDCVGYIVPSSLGYIENEMPRMVMTSWFDSHNTRDKTKPHRQTAPRHPMKFLQAAALRPSPLPPFRGYAPCAMHCSY